MARRMRAVERASARQAVTDKVIVVLVGVVAAAGLMSLLPGSSQAAVRRVVCQAGSLGLSSCTPSTLALGLDRLSPPRCAVLAGLDAVLPEVRTSRLTSAGGVTVEASSARSGQITLRLGEPDTVPLPFTLEGQPRGTRTLLPGADVPTGTEWTLPSDAGADAVVDAVSDAHQRWLTRRSALAAVFSLLGRDAGGIPAPTVRYSRVELDRRVLPGRPVPATVTPGRTPTRSASYVTVRTDEPATVQHDRTDGQTAVVAGLTGVVRGRPATGTVRWTRDADGDLRDVLVALVSTTSLVKGERAVPAGSVAVSYLAVPVQTAAEQQLAQAWLADPEGFRLGLDPLLLLTPPAPTDQLTTFLVRAASLTTLHYAGVDLGTGAALARQELVTLRRTEWAGHAPTFAGRVDPQPGGAARALVADPACGP